MDGGFGIICHLTSLPNSKLSDAEKFISYLSNHDCAFWQFLPITPPDKFGSPYASPSAFAGHSDFCDNETMCEMNEDEYWIHDWALFSTIKKKMNGQPWHDWPQELRDRDPIALENLLQDCQSEYDLQARFLKQWMEMKSLANSKGIKLIGDLPIFISHDSADVWSHRELFQLDENGMPAVVAGVPPDYFSKDGQKWNTVLYSWDQHKKENWRWWGERLARMLRLFDIVRIDHFRGFHSAWAIPTNAKDGKIGEWQIGPGDELLNHLINIAGNSNRIIAEDLGIIPQEVVEMRLRSKLKGMAILQFGFTGNDEDNPHHPINIGTDKIAYTGTHDNNTTIGWWNELDDEIKNKISTNFKENEDVVDYMMRMAFESKASIVIVPLQDLLKLNSESRMNIPGVEKGNWQWKFEWNHLEIEPS